MSHIHVYYQGNPTCDLLLLLTKIHPNYAAMMQSTRPWMEAAKIMQKSDLQEPKMYIVMTIYEPSNTWCPNCIHSINIPLDTPLNEDMHGVSDGGRNIVQNYDAWYPKCTLFQCH